MDKTSVVKVVMLTLSTVVALAPIIQALNDYGWELLPLITPSYSPPKVDFSMRFVGARFEKENLYVTFELKNVGEVEVVLESLNAAVYGPDGAAIASATLVHGVDLEPGAAEPVLVRISLEEEALDALKSYIVEMGLVNLDLRGTIVVGVFGSRAAVPFTASLPLSGTDLGLG